METIEPNQTATALLSPTEPRKAVPSEVPKKKSSFILLFIIIFIGVILSILIALLMPLPNAELQPQPSPVNQIEASPQTLPTERKVSEFGESTDFINFETQLNNLKSDMANTNLSESELTYPLLDMHVTFQK